MPEAVGPLEGKDAASPWWEHSFAPALSPAVVAASLSGLGLSLNDCVALEVGTCWRVQRFNGWDPCCILLVDSCSDVIIGTLRGVGGRGVGGLNAHNKA